MGTLKKFIEIFSTDTAFGRALSPALQEISDRLDALERLTKDIAYDLEFPGKPVAQDKRSCENCGVGHMECHTDGVRPYCDEWQPKQPKEQDERSCDEYELPDLYHAGVIKPKAQEQGHFPSFEKNAKEAFDLANKLDEMSRFKPKAQEPAVNSPEWCKLNNCNPIHDTQEQGGDDKPIQGCYYDHDDCEAVRDLRARIALLEKENAELRDWNKAAKESVAIASAEVSKLQAENAELKRQLEATIAPAEVGGGIVAHLKQENAKLKEKLQDFRNALKYHKLD